MEIKICTSYEEVTFTLCFIWMVEVVVILTSGVLRVKDECV